jgi:choline transport protein
VAWAISFGVMAPKHDASFVFKLFLNNSGYTSSAWVFIMSFYTPMYGLYGTDGMMHLVEEMRDASKQAPVSSTLHLFNYLLIENPAGHGLVYDFL